MPELAIRDKTAFYRAVCEGEKTILFVHGAGCNSLYWTSVKPPENWNALALDLPGHGFSKGPALSDIFEYASWVEEFIESLGQRVLLVGHSMGGAIAMAVALNRPEPLLGLVLAGSGAKLGVSPALLKLCHGDDPAKIEALMAEYAYSALTSKERIQSWQRQFGGSPCETYLADFTACNGFDIMERLSGIKLPVLAVCGTEDRLTPLKYSQYLATHLPDAVLAEIPAAGHMVMLEQPAAFSHALNEFCRSRLKNWQREEKHV